VSLRTNLVIGTLSTLMFAVLAPTAAQTIAPLPERVTPTNTWTDHTWTSPDGTKFPSFTISNRARHAGDPTPWTDLVRCQQLFNPGIAQKLAKKNRVIRAGGKTRALSAVNLTRASSGLGAWSVEEITS
jgi:hypothetical protein